MTATTFCFRRESPDSPAFASTKVDQTDPHVLSKSFETIYVKTISNMLPTALYTVASIAGWLFGVITLYSATTSTYLVVANMLVSSLQTFNFGAKIV